DRDRAAERHVEVRVRVDTARQHVLAGRVYRPVGGDVELGADECDPLALDEDVGDVVVGGGDDTPSANQDRHRFRVSARAMSLSPGRTVAELRELQELTGDENGAQRVAWTETWERARQWLREKVVPTGAEEEVDEAGNQWFTLPGASERALLLGGHIDSVPNGGWLDGS